MKEFFALAAFSVFSLCKQSLYLQTKLNPETQNKANGKNDICEVFRVAQFFLQLKHQSQPLKISEISTLNGIEIRL
jgi:hypothetical protein